jgi:hypothetical protein
MQMLKQDLSIFKKFDFKKQPVGVKFLPTRPEGIEQLDKAISFLKKPRKEMNRFILPKRMRHALEKHYWGWKICRHLRKEDRLG